MSAMEKGLTFGELPIGRSIEVEYTIEDRHVRLFADATGDANPLHVDDAYAAASPFKRRIAHGVLLSGIVSGILGMKFPGLGTIAREMYSKYMKPVYIGDTVKITAEVTERTEKINLCKISFKVANSDGIIVAKGYAVVLPPT